MTRPDGALLDLLQIALDPLLLLPSFNGNSLSESWHAMLLSILRSIFCEPHAGFYHTGINKWKVYHNLIKEVLKKSQFGQCALWISIHTLLKINFLLLYFFYLAVQSNA